MKRNQEIWDSNFIHKHIKSFSSVLVIGYKNTSLKKILDFNKNHYEEINFNIDGVVGENLEALKNKINSAKKDSEFCIINLLFMKNFQQITDDIFDVSRHILLPIKRKKYSYLEFKRFCVKNRIKIEDVVFYKNNRQLIGFFAKYFFDKAFLVITKDIHAPTYQEEFIKDKILNLFTTKKRVNAISNIGKFNKNQSL